MDPATLEMIAPVFVFLGLSGAVLIGMKMRYTHLQRTRLSGTAHQDVERLADTVDTVRDEVRILREEFLELHERLEFTERLLERPKTDTDLGSPPGQQV
jgi:hypothetical protein